MNVVVIWCAWCLVIVFDSVTAKSRNSLRVKRNDNESVAARAFYGEYPPQWFSQKLDHFQPTNNQTWNQRYWVSKIFYKKGGPVFIMIGAEGEETPSDLYDSSMMNNAALYNASMFVLEHRFYGSSHPTSDLSVENLKYLSSLQALADAAYFIASMNLKYNFPEETKWIAFGGSYAGSLSAWLRYKYPHLVYGAVASSAPLLAKVDFPEYLDMVRNALKEVQGDECVSVVHSAVEELESILMLPNYNEILKSRFGICETLDIQNKNDVSGLFYAIFGIIPGVVQYNLYDPTTNRTSISEMCEILLFKPLGSPLDRMYFLNQFNTCLDYSYRSLVENDRYQFWNNSANERQWTYQTCTEFGFFQTSKKNQSLLGNHTQLETEIQLCVDLFGDEFTEDFIQRAVNYTNTVYGGLALKATRVIYVQGSLDPWHVLGLTKTRISKSPVIFIQGTSHCADMYSDRYYDPPALTKARKEISAQIGRWLK